MDFQTLLSFDLTPAAIISAAAALAAAVTLASLLLPRLNRVSRRVTDDTSSLRETGGEPTSYPPVSVIVTSSGSSVNLDILLPQILGQDYPVPFEVVIVDDGDDPATEAVVSRLQMSHTNLYMTYAPANSRNLSRKKLSVTLGVKAARYDTLMLTCGNCRVNSPKWLRSMMRHIAYGSSIVVGYSIAHPADSDATVPRFRAFSMARTAVEFLNAAITGNLYRADGNNLAYTRALFYSANGFSDSLNYVYGDDDLFISRISHKGNYSVELSEDSMVESLQANPAKSFRNENDTRRFTGRMLRRATPRLWGFISVLWWIWLAATSCAIVTSLPSLVGTAAMVVIAAMLTVPVMLAWRRVSTHLRSRPLCLTTICFSLIHPFFTIWSRLRKSDVKNYTWQ